VTDNLINIADFIKKEFKAQKVILFGSYAYGKPTVDSDIDLFVIMDTKERFPKVSASIRIAIHNSFSLKKPMDIIVRTPDFVEDGIKEGDFFIRDIMEKGIEL